MDGAAAHLRLSSSMWTYLIGPIAALLPKTWRRALPFAEDVEWGPATAISGAIEFVLGLIALGQWYTRGMSLWVGYGVSQALDGKMGTEVRLQDIGGASLVIWATHPLTWLIGFFALEGAVRVCAGAFSGSACGVFPLYLIDAITLRPFRRRSTVPIEAGAGARANVSSMAGAIRERVQTSHLREVPDELVFLSNESGEMLEVHTWRRKQDWTPPRIMRYQDSYYRLEAEAKARGARPFVYHLRRLAAGVPSRSVMMYNPPDAMVRELAKK